MGINWNYPTTMWIGENRIEDLPLACKDLNILNPLFVTDKDLINLDLIKNIISRLKKSFKNLATFSNFTGNPTGENVEEGVKVYSTSGCDGVIALGGGSGLDVGKAIAFMCNQSRPLWDLKILVIIGQEQILLKYQKLLQFQLLLELDPKLEERLQS